MPKIALILGSARTPGNGKGLASWLTPIIESRLNPSQTVETDSYHLVLVDPNSPPHPLGPVTDGTKMPVQIRDPALYASPAVRDWSAFVSSCAGFVILTPQYNWGVPGELKNSFDHLYWEWRDKPVLLITYGGHGGSKCAVQLRNMLGGAFKMPLVSESVEITLPEHYISGDERVPTNGQVPDFLQPYELSLHEAADELRRLLSAPSTIP
ncbi:hypothetical protein AcW1_000666 [Taiwanofungus camphoratus]|nr:hypothetical protein AcW2_000835 [Antrodia cinnamomea]KAI0936417.1 hypothetical protein AcV5_004564 [Antrodia cinnamomea]KAI0961635.1 hypothetical protein AcV7_000685 [Antrodia cinnamomea]KAI0963648.1 hypothetical protein AcW1_000666 [Antrodia cinnamomea]